MIAAAGSGRARPIGLATMILLMKIRDGRNVGKQ